MKQILSWLGLMMIAGPMEAQQPGLDLSTDKTTSLIFSCPILHVDRGTKDVLALPVQGAANILLVKAAAKNFPSTNLSVVTRDGNVYCFPVQYSEHPSGWVYRLPVPSGASLSTYADVLLDNPPTMRSIRSTKGAVSALVKGIYIKGRTMFCQLEIINHSPLDYELESLRFFLRDQKTARRTALQEIEQQPLLLRGETAQVKASNKSTIVVALEKSTLPDGKYLAVEIMEKGGGRHLQLKIKNRHILRALTLPDLK